MRICFITELEIRPTIVPKFFGSEKEVSEIAKWIASNFNKEIPFIIQQGIPKHALLESLRNIKPFNRDEMLSFSMGARKYLNNVGIRTKEYGNEMID